VGQEQILHEARQAVADHSWQAAFAAFSALETGGLSPEDLESFAQAAYWSSHVPEAIAAEQRAFVTYETSGRAAEAAYAALIISLVHFGLGDTSVATGWLGRGKRLLIDVPEHAAHALLAWVEGQLMLRLKGFDQALEKANEVEAIARRVGDGDLIAMGMSMQGFLRAQTGDPAGGLALIDEALSWAFAGQLGPFAEAEVFCEMVVACTETADFQRAAEWLDMADRADRKLTCFPGCCRVHRSTVLRHRGEWSEAQRQAQLARVEVAGAEVLHEGMALTELGELHRCKGEATLAEREYAEAYEKGWPPQPGLALLRLFAGDVVGATQLIGTAVEWSSDDLSALVRLLPAQVDIAIAAGDNDVVEGAAARLSEVAATLGSSAAAAASAGVIGVREHQRGNLKEAARHLQRSISLWQKVRNPYEAARARMRLADVLTQLGDVESAKLEVSAARKAFEGLGAAPDLVVALKRLGEDAPTHLAKTFMFTDVVDSTSLLSALGDEAWDGIRRWHDDMITTIVTEHQGTIVKGTGDGFFITFSEPALAADCAIAIQRALDAHRRKNGFSPTIRIGLHAGSAIAAGGDYSGHDVVIAARIAALAAGDEILVSSSVAEHLGAHVQLTAHRVAELKGIPEPHPMAAIDWRS
jgi:class 3 adenylate cyclase